MSKKRKTAYETGKKLEERTDRWLKSQFGYDCKRNELVRGKISKRPYEVDIHAMKSGFLGFGQTDLWVECKVYKIKRTHVTKLVESARDMRDAFNDSIEDWRPDILMLVSNRGFDVDAIGMADKYNIYCVKAGKRKYNFVGGLSRDNLKSGKGSDY